MPDLIREHLVCTQVIESDLTHGKVQFPDARLIKHQVESFAQAERSMYLENCIYEIIQKNVKRLEIGKRDIRGVIF